jgi:hypothetical protein
MAVNLSPVAGAAAQFLDNSGNVLTGGKLFTYAAGTTTPQASYTSGAGTTFHSNPIILDAAGRVPAGGEIWLTDGLQYKFVLTDANDVLIGTWDNLIGINSNFLNYYTQEEIQTATAGQTVFTLSTLTYTPGTNSLSVFVDGVNQYDGSSFAYVETNSTTITFTAGLHVGALVKFTTAVSLSSGVNNASLVTYDPPFIGGVATTVEAKLAQTVSVVDFGATGDGVTDDTVAIQNAHNALPTEGGTILFPSGAYLISASLLFSKRVYLDFQGAIGLQLSTPSSAYLKVAATMASGNALVLSGDGSRVFGGGIQGVSGNGANGLAIQANTVSAINFGIGNMGGIGFLIGDVATGINVNLWKLDTCHAYSNVSHGFYFNSPTLNTDCNAGTAINCDASLNDGDGFKIDNALKNSFVSCTAQINTGAGFRFTSNTIGNKMFGGDQDEGNIAGNILNETGATGNCFFGCDDLGFTDSGTNTTFINRLQSRVRQLAFGSSPDYLSAYVARTSFTPTIYGSTAAGTQTYSVQQGYYTQLGNEIQFYVTIALSATSGATGFLRIGVLPGNASTLSGLSYACTIGEAGSFNIGAGYRLGAAISGGLNYITLYALADNAATVFASAAALGANSTITISGRYYIN